MLVRHTLSLDDAKAVAAAAAAKAGKEGWSVVIAILDASGHLLYLERADGTQLASVSVAQEKARTALMFRRPSQVFEDMILGGKIHVMGLPGVTPVAGGLPLSWRGEIVGAIGVSGVLSSQDAEVAQSGLAVLADDRR
jgi:glc operon protein GlcG